MSRCILKMSSQVTERATNPTSFWDIDRRIGQEITSIWTNVQSITASNLQVLSAFGLGRARGHVSDDGVLWIAGSGHRMQCVSSGLWIGGVRMGQEAPWKTYVFFFFF